MELLSLGVKGPSVDLDGTLKSAAKERANALITVRNPVTFRHVALIADFTIKRRLPSLGEGNDFAEAGSLLSYTASDVEMFRRTAVFVDKILKGRKPADLPVKQPMKFEFIVNLKAAKQIGVTIPPNVLVRAQRVIR